MFRKKIGDYVDLNLGTRSSGSKVNHEEAKEFGPWMLVDRRLKRLIGVKVLARVLRKVLTLRDLILMFCLI